MRIGHVRATHSFLFKGPPLLFANADVASSCVHHKYLILSSTCHPPRFPFCSSSTHGHAIVVPISPHKGGFRETMEQCQRGVSIKTASKEQHFEKKKAWKNLRATDRNLQKYY